MEGKVVLFSVPVVSVGVCLRNKHGWMDGWMDGLLSHHEIFMGARCDQSYDYFENACILKHWQIQG